MKLRQVAIAAAVIGVGATGLSALSAKNAADQDGTAIRYCGSSMPAKTVEIQGTKYAVTLRGQNIGSVCSNDPRQEVASEASDESFLTSCSDLSGLFHVNNQASGHPQGTTVANGQDRNVKVILHGDYATLCLE